MVAVYQEVGAQSSGVQETRRLAFEEEQVDECAAGGNLALRWRRRQVAELSRAATLRERKLARDSRVLTKSRRRDQETQAQDPTLAWLQSQWREDAV